MGLPSAALAHTGEATRGEVWWQQWSWEPLVLVSLLCTGWLYGHGLCRVWRDMVGRGVRRWEAWAFAVGWGCVRTALVLPLHPFGGVLFSAIWRNTKY